MILEVLHRYLTVIIACIALLAGLQLPNLADQYQKRVDAHLREVTINFQPFLIIANQYTNGDIEALIAMHRKSGEKAFQEEGNAIEKMYRRKLRFEAELAALQTSLPYRIVHILFHGDREIMDETLAQYTYTVPLSQDALAVGAAITAAVMLALELLLAMVRLVERLVSRRTGVLPR